MSVELVRVFSCSCGVECREYIDHLSRCWRTTHGEGEAVFVITLQEICDAIENADVSINGVFDRWLDAVHAYEGASEWTQ